MTHQEAFDEINKIQDEYIDELITFMNNPAYDSMKMLNFTSPTGTGKTKMMSKLIKRYSKAEYYFIITTLSKGQLHIQIRNNLAKDLVGYDNYYVYGSADFKVNSKLDAETLIGRIPEGSKCIWLRDEGHIRTNKWDEVLLDVCYKVINFSATNTHSDIQCNFTQTMMLRTVNQNLGTPEDAINKLLEVKKAHKSVKEYNPCAIFRCVSGDTGLQKMIEDLCKLYGLKYIDITEETYNMQEICEDNNEYDVIINKFKIVEGIDIRRAHVLYMDNQPGNNATTIQVIGRCRRNALLYRNDIDILDSKNKKLLDATRECYVYYNVEKMRIDEDENGELQYAFCNHISCQALKSNSIIEVKDGQLSNGLYIIELKDCTGKYEIKIDESTGFNIVLPITKFYEQHIKQRKNYIYIKNVPYNIFNTSEERLQELWKLNTYWLKNTPTRNKISKKIFDYSIGQYKIDVVNTEEPFIYLKDALGEHKKNYLYKLTSTETCKQIYNKYIANIENTYMTKDEICNLSKDICIPGTTMTLYNFDINWFKNYLNNYISKYKNTKGYKTICKFAINAIKSNYTLNIITAYMRCYTKNSEWSYWWLYEHITDETTIKCELVNWLLNISNSNFRYEFNSDNTYNNFLYDYNDYISKEDIISNLLLKTHIIDITDYDFLNHFESLLMRSHSHTKYDVLTKQFIVDYIKYDIQICDDKQGAIQKDIKLATTLYNLLINGFVIPEVFIYDKSRLEPLSYEENCIKQYLEPYSYIIDHRFSIKDIDDLTKYKEYTKLFNDCESSIIGTDLMRQVKDEITDEVIWIESKSVSSKIGNYNKFNSFISQHYKNELNLCRTQLCKGNNNFKLPTRCNSVIGYCVEYYSKYLVYGKDSLLYYIQMACKESKVDYKPNTKLSDMLIIRACMLQYRANMVKCFGPRVSKVIKTISVSQMIRDEYKEFVNLVVTLGKQTAKFVKKQLYKNEVINNIDPNLSINHITGLADYITEDTILDIKVRGGIGESEVRQVLAYHYLSTKRSDLNIKRVIVYDATSGRHVSINITPENWKENQPYGYKD